MRKKGKLLSNNRSTIMRALDLPSVTHFLFSDNWKLLIAKTRSIKKETNEGYTTSPPFKTMAEKKISPVPKIIY